MQACDSMRRGLRDTLQRQHLLAGAYAEGNAVCASRCLPRSEYAGHVRVAVVIGPGGICGRRSHSARHTDRIRVFGSSGLFVGGLGRFCASETQMSRLWPLRRSIVVSVDRIVPQCTAAKPGGKRRILTARFSVADCRAFDRTKQCTRHGGCMVAH